MSNNFQTLFLLEILYRLLVPDRLIAPHATGEKVDRSKSMQDRNATIEMPSKLKSTSNFIEYTLKFQFWILSIAFYSVLWFFLLKSAFDIYRVRIQPSFDILFQAMSVTVVRVSHRYNFSFCPRSRH